MVPVDDLAETSARSAPNSASKQKQAQDAEAALSIFAARRKAAEEQRVAHHRVAVDQHAGAGVLVPWLALASPQQQ